MLTYGARVKKNFTAPGALVDGSFQGFLPKIFKEGRKKPAQPIDSRWAGLDVPLGKRLLIPFVPYKEDRFDWK